MTIWINFTNQGIRICYNYKAKIMRHPLIKLGVVYDIEKLTCMAFDELQKQEAMAGTCLQYGTNGNKIDKH